MVLVINSLLKNLILTPSIRLPCALFHVTHTQFRDRPRFVEKPKPGVGKAYRRIVHYEDEYTIKPLEVTNLAGRDPVTGRVVANGIGGGIKHKYHWIDWKREGPKEGPPQLEKVIRIIKCGCRTSDVALVAVGEKLKYILATENMKAGDILKTSSFIPRMAVRAKEGDAYPLGALPIGTQVHNIAPFADRGGAFVHSAGSFAVIKRHIQGKIIVQMPSKQEFGFAPECMATVGRLSNVAHGSTPIGSAQRNRELGNRPRSGLWQRKTGRHGRKIRALPPIKFFNEPLPPPPEEIRLTLNMIEN